VLRPAVFRSSPLNPDRGLQSMSSSFTSVFPHAATNSTRKSSAPSRAMWACVRSRYRPHITSSTWLFSSSASLQALVTPYSALVILLDSLAKFGLQRVRHKIVKLRARWWTKASNRELGALVTSCEVLAEFYLAKLRKNERARKSSESQRGPTRTNLPLRSASTRI